MGLADRYYMRQSSGGLNWSATTILLALNGVVFLLQLTVLPYIWSMDYLALSLEGLKHGFVWQLLTFQFLHASWLHIIFNSIALFFFGRSVEAMLGARRFTQLYLWCGVGGGLAQMFFAGFWPQFHGGAVVGASAGVSGLIATFAMMNWSNRFTLLFYFFPIQMSGRTLLWISLGFAILGLLFPGGNNVAHAAHLGGILGGVAWVRLGWHRDFIVPPWERLLARMPRFKFFSKRQRQRELFKAATIKTPGWPPAKGTLSADLPEEEFISKEVDPILDKISAHGIQSLTERERAILERARNKMAKR
jgi:membrane associated rhomboid family serine protease